MKHEPQEHQRRSVRLKAYDYSQPGACFLTICARDGEPLFGGIENGRMQLNALGEIAKQEWVRPAVVRSNVALDDFAVIPNHLHGIVVLVDSNLPGPVFRRGDSASRPYMPHQPHGPSPNSVGAIVGQFKSLTAKRINAVRETPGARVWQRNYYEHVIRNEDELHRVRQYIVDNPAQWDLDEYNPDRRLPAGRLRSEAGQRK